MLIRELTSFLESLAPLSLQESYDNSGLLIGDPASEISKALISLDVTEEVIREAIENKCDIIISHHPLIFSGIKKLNSKNSTERIIISAIKNNIAIYAIHTNLDNVSTGVNRKICDVLGLENCKILEPKTGLLKQLITYVPDKTLDNGKNVPDAVREALWSAGAGSIGDYDSCSFNVEGKGTFRALPGATPCIGNVNELSKQDEQRISVVFPAYLEGKVLRALFSAHPYEEVAYELISLDNENQEIGAGMIGELPEAMNEPNFLKFVKDTMHTSCIRHTDLLNKEIKRVAVCGGSGSFLLKAAMANGADAFITADFKYHQFFDAEGKILIADVGHFESERFTIDLLHDAIHEKFRNFALLKTLINTNPVNYF